MEENKDYLLRLWQDHLPLAYNEIHRLAKRWPKVDKKDIEQAGLLGLWVAATKYDPIRLSKRTGKPCKFTTYAVYGVRTQILQMVRENHILGARAIVAKTRNKYQLPQKIDFASEKIEKGRISRSLEQFPDLYPEYCESVDCLLKKVTKRKREVIQYYFFDDLTYAEIGAIFGKTRAWAQHVCTRALKEIAEKGRQECPF